MGGLRTPLLLIVVSVTLLHVCSATFEDEMKTRVAQTEKLLNDYKAFVASVDSEGDKLLNKLDNNNKTFNTKTKNSVNYHGPKFEEYLTAKRKSLDEFITKTWKSTEKNAAAKEKTLGNYNKMVNLNITEAYWHAVVDNKNWRTNLFTNHIKALDEILTSIETHGFEAMKTSVENLKDGQMTPEEQLSRKEKEDVLKAEFLKLAQYAASAQFHEEEKQRTEGQSGIKQIRTASSNVIILIYLIYFCQYQILGKCSSCN